MTALEKRLLKQWENGAITTDAFKAQFPIDVQNNASYAVDKINKALKSDKNKALNSLIHLIYLCDNKAPFIDILNALLLNPHHKSHQFVTKNLQQLKHPSSVTFIEQALATNFDYLNYTGSEPEVIAKWFSWALFSIGTEEAVNTLKQYAQSDNAGIKKEMLYRLNKF
jgi:hypothetical protein